MRRLLLGALPFAVLAAMLALRAWDPLLLQQLRWYAFDQHQRLAPRHYDPAMPDVAPQPLQNAAAAAPDQRTSMPSSGTAGVLPAIRSATMRAQPCDIVQPI